MAKASLDRPTVWETAFHEAGHVVAMIATGEYPERVHLSDDPESDHAGRTTKWPTVFGPVGAAMLASKPALHHVLLPYSREVMVLLAGDVASRLARGSEPEPEDLAVPVDDPDPDSSDDRKLAALTSDVYWQVAMRWVQKLAGVTITIMKDRWDDVCLLAQALVARRELSKDDLEELFPPGPPSHLDALKAAAKSQASYDLRTAIYHGGRADREG